MKRVYSLFLTFALLLGLTLPARAAGENPFTDITPRDYFYDAVLWAKGAGVTAGTTDTTFSPSDTCTRGQVVTFLWRAMEKPAPQSIDNPFADVQPGDYYHEAVLWAVEQGITAGTTAATFSPEDNCTSAQVITFLWRAMGKPSVKAAGTVAEGYSDADYYKTPVAWADSAGLLKLSGGALDPMAASPRADIVTYLYLALDKDVKTPREALVDMTGWGVNLGDLFMAMDTGIQGDTLGYVTRKPGSEAFGIGITYWNENFDWLAFHEAHEGSLQASIPLPTYNSGDTVSEWAGGLFRAEFFTDIPNTKVEVTLQDSKLVLADGSAVPLSVMDGKYSVITGSEADLNGWYRATLEFDRSKLPVPGEKLNGARLETTILSDLTFYSPEEKADFFMEYRHEPMGMERYTDVYLDEGINVIRLPVTWSQFVDDETFEIEPIWLERVAREVDYILQNNAYCILNVHNDYLGRSFVGDHWETRWMDERYKDYVDRRFMAIWEQIAEYFKDYPRKLMFETANEPTMNWYNGIAEDYEGDYEEIQASRINELNDLFVKTVRSTGGKNTDRILNIVTAGYNTAHNLPLLTPPEDDYLMVQVHSYDQIEAREPGFDSKAETDKFFAYIDEFTARTGIPAIIGETGVSHLQPEEAYLTDISYFFTQARQRGIPVLWFECHFRLSDDREHLGNIYWLYDKVTGAWGRPKILRTIKEAVGEA